jgi:hypothetical protein
MFIYFNVYQTIQNHRQALYVTPRPRDTPPPLAEPEEMELQQCQRQEQGSLFNLLFHLLNVN